jgi:ComF family protein
MLDRLIRILKEAFFPLKCAVCGTLFHPPEKAERLYHPFADTFDWETVTFEKLMAPLLCPDCLCNFMPAESPLCSVCGFVFESREGNDHICGNCIEHPKRFRKARALGIYDKTLMKIIHSFKYKAKLQLARPLQNLLFSVLVRNWNIDDFDLVVPVPLHVKRLRSRGFNQAYLLVKDWPEITGNLKSGEKKKNRFHKFEIGKDALCRTIWTQPQTGLGRKKRMENIKGAFSVGDRFEFGDKRVLLVDDVYTTGATIDECAKTILEKGAASVDVLTLARAV